MRSGTCLRRLALLPRSSLIRIFLPFNSVPFNFVIAFFISPSVANSATLPQQKYTMYTKGIKTVWLEPAQTASLSAEMLIYSSMLLPHKNTLVWFILRPCQHDDGYLDGRSQINVHTDERTQVNSDLSSLTVTWPSANQGQCCLTSVNVPLNFPWSPLYALVWN